MDILLCICDHFEPFHDASRDEALRRVDEWAQQFPSLSESFQDADGCRPAHTFFYPIEQYDRAILAQLSTVCAKSHAEIEVHLHHDKDTAANLLETLETAKSRLQSHGALCKDEGGRIRFAFIHGKWALDDSHPSGRFCGVRNELDVLCKAGCYADFTMPSAPDPTQTRLINSIYRAEDTVEAKSHDRGHCLRAGQPQPQADEQLLLVQGPLGLNWKRRKLRLLPRLENGEISGSNPPTAMRMKLWLELNVHVIGRPNWTVVKLHTHGGIPANMRVLLGPAMKAFHQVLAAHYNNGKNFRLHYVTARELTNIILAAEAGNDGNPHAFRDYIYRRL